MKTPHVLACLVVVLTALGACSRETPPAAPAKADADTANPGPGVTVKDEDAKRLGIELAPVEVASVSAVASGTAVVLDSTELLASLDELAASRSETATLDANAARLTRLQGEGNASSQMLETARSEAAAAHARLSASEAKVRAAWGSVPAASGGMDVAAVREQLAQHGAQLVRAEFPEALPADPAGLHYLLERGAAPSGGIAARYVGMSYSPAAAAVGSAVTLLAPTGALAPRPGSRLPVTAATEGGPSQALVPEAAAIADGGQLWCYVARPAGRFDRIALDADQRVGARYPARELKPDDRVVVRGASLLLSLERGAGEPASAAGDEDD